MRIKIEKADRRAGEAAERQLGELRKRRADKTHPTIAEAESTELDLYIKVGCKGEEDENDTNDLDLLAARRSYKRVQKREYPSLKRLLLRDIAQAIGAQAFTSAGIVFFPLQESLKRN